MKKALVFSTLASAAVATLAQSAPPPDAREMGRVLSTVPVVQQVPVSQQVCGSQQVVSQAPASGAGTVIGGIAGGVLGNAIGHGSGRAAATALGIVGGAVMGNRVEGPGATYVQNVPTCGTQTTYQSRTVGYDVTYEYAGRQYTTRMASDPGSWVPVQVGAAGGNQQQAQQPTYSTYTPPPVVEQGVVVSPGYAAAPAVVYTQNYVPAYAPVPVYAPAYAPVYYGGYGGYGGLAPIGLSLNLGYSRGFGGGHGRWR